MATFGESLRRERELRDISLREIADATKINLRYLEALEQNRFDILPGGVFNKGFIRAYARFIGADGESLVDLYLLETAPRDPGGFGASGGAAAPPGLLRLPEPPARRADTPTPPARRAEPATPPARRAEPVTPPAVTAAAIAAKPAPATQAAAANPTTGSSAAPAPAPAPVGANAAAKPTPAATVPATAPAPTAPAAGSGSGTPATATQPAPAPRPSPAPRPAAPLRVASLPQHHEPLTERAAAIAAITNPHLTKETATRRAPGSSFGIFLAAGGVVLAGAIAILVTRGLRARDGVPALPAATAPSISEATHAAQETPGDATLDPSSAAAEGPEADADLNAAPPPATAAPSDGASPSPLGAAIGAGFGPRSAVKPSSEPFPPPSSRPRGTPIEAPPAPRQVPPAAAAPATAPVAIAPRPPALPGMEFRIEASDQVWAQVSCDGEDRLNRMLQAGEGTTLRCLSTVRVSVTDGGAVRLMVDGARCNTPAEKGYEMKGFMIRVENAAAICPPGPGGPYERR